MRNVPCCNDADITLPFLDVKDPYQRTKKHLYSNTIPREIIQVTNPTACTALQLTYLLFLEILETIL